MKVIGLKLVEILKRKVEKVTLQKTGCKDESRRNAALQPIRSFPASIKDLSGDVCFSSSSSEACPSCLPPLEVLVKNGCVWQAETAMEIAGNVTAVAFHHHYRSCKVELSFCCSEVFWAVQLYVAVEGLIWVLFESLKTSFHHVIRRKPSIYSLH